MSNKIQIPCKIIQDLLPLYIDGLTQSETNEEIEQHLTQCQDCQERYARMSGTIVLKPEELQEDKQELDFLKKVRRGNRRRIILSLLGVFVFAFLCSLAKIFFIGIKTEEYILTSYEKTGGTIKACGEIENGYAYRGYHVDSKGKVTIYAIPQTPWNHDTEFQIDLEVKKDSDFFVFNNKTVYGDGSYYSNRVIALYQAQNSFIGDAAADEKLADLMGIRYKLGDYTMELVTDREPYQWIFHLKKNLNDINFSNELLCQNYACIIFALVENVEEIHFEFFNQKEEYFISYTREQCNKYISDLKNDMFRSGEGSEYEDLTQYGKSVKKLDELLEMIDMWWMYQ